MRMPKLREATTVAALAIALLVPAAPALAAPAQAAATGTISGHYRTAAGEPVPTTTVRVSHPDYSGDRWTQLGADGAFALDVEPGEYLVYFDSWSNGDQFAYGKVKREEAARFTVDAGQTVTVDDVALPTGTVSGTLTDAAGQPVPYSFVRAYNPDGSWAGGATVFAGHYTLPGLHPGDYLLSFALTESNDSVYQFAPGQKTQSTAGRYTVTADQTLTVNEQLLPTGTLAGRVLTAAGGPAPARLRVDAYLAASGPYSGIGGYTDADGRFSFLTFADDYQVSFQTAPGGYDSQFFTGKRTREAADWITVRPNESTDVVDSILATGSVRVTATDAATGAPIGNVCASIDFHYACAGGNGEALVEGVTIGGYTAYVYADGYEGREVPVTVLAGQAVALPTSMTATPMVTVTVRDAAGNPVAGARPCLLALTSSYVGCGYSPAMSDANGVAKIHAPQVTGDYRMFVEAPETGGFGAQWVGASGGTGDAFQAAPVHVVAGQSSTAPDVRLDRAGAIAGKITDKATGAPLANVTVGLRSLNPGSDECSCVRTDASGQYRIGGLGPYAWPLFFTHLPEHASQWSGGAGDRTKAKKIQVVAGGTTNYFAKLSQGNTVSGTVAGAAQWVRVLAVNAVTGDIMGWANVGADGRYTMRVAGPQTVRFVVEDSGRSSGPIVMPSVDAAITVNL
ncbi:carboxypeptidase regulatory-like domain-containing protein [Longispora sp. K20-0274]|uniref:carboxypeptidase regulatory-like domain-containing protein n=1 Tax=Longispora sp. K20-0274 TaxID=3088255 RepID=UPI00399B1195